MGYPVFYSDKEAKNILNTNPSVIASIRETFGEKAYKNQELNRPYIAEQVFNDSNLLKAINEIVHPVVRQSFSDWVDQQKTDLVFNEAAILFETGAYKKNDYNVLITAPEEIRISRVVQRDAVSREEVKKRIDKQWTDSKKEKLASHIIINDAKAMLIPQVITLLEKLKK